MKSNLQNYTQCFTSFTTLRTSSFSYTNLKNTSIILLLVLSDKSSECDEYRTSKENNVFTLTKSERENICNSLNITDETLRKNLVELENYNCIEKISKNEYRLNPFLFCKGKEGGIERLRTYCESNDIFYPLNKTKKQKFSFIFNNIENLNNYCCFSGKHGSKVINKTELSIFLMLSSETVDCKYSKSPELCNTIEITTDYYKRISKMLGIDERSARRAVSNLCEMHLLHKFEKVNNKYMINPYIAARGKISDIRNLQIEMMDKRHSKFFDGCAEGDVEFYKRKELSKSITIKSIIDKK